ncbi:DUF4238 domain-containing protein [Thalassospira xiamenensis]|uniref:DUF4238 domain-containing protein n=1 Tax=Thalassospira xiamenensis TaxID=220697 RepID=A0A285TT97_9PROT|nr:DUF4238 domain-containing protein [Thalassospira xiamenensis]SOC26962.1 Protein of unknown function [Thalassospira xiamenensis]
MTKTKKPFEPKHHFVPQFWIKQFRPIDNPSIPENQKYHVYVLRDTASGIELKFEHTSGLMQVPHLYTIQPDGVANTDGETVYMNEVDDKGSKAFQAILDEDYSAAVRDALAEFFAVQFMRAPETLSRHAPLSQDLASGIRLGLDAGSYNEFCQMLQGILPTVPAFSEEEYQSIVEVSKDMSENERNKWEDELCKLLSVPGGNADIPFTDLLHDRSGLAPIKSVLLDMQWTLKKAESGDFILGDAPLLTDKGDISSGIRIPFSISQALYLTPAAATTRLIETDIASANEVYSLNLESAARTRQWLIGSKQALEDSDFQHQFRSARPLTQP